MIENKLLGNDCWQLVALDKHVDETIMTIALSSIKSFMAEQKISISLKRITYTVFKVMYLQPLVEYLVETLMIDAVNCSNSIRASVMEA